MEAEPAFETSGFFFNLDDGQSPKRWRLGQQYKMFDLRCIYIGLFINLFKAHWLLYVPPG